LIAVAATDSIDVIIRFSIECFEIVLRFISYLCCIGDLRINHQRSPFFRFSRFIC